MTLYNFKWSAKLDAPSHQSLLNLDALGGVQGDSLPGVQGSSPESWEEDCPLPYTIHIIGRVYHLCFLLCMKSIKVSHKKKVKKSI